MVDTSLDGTLYALGVAGLAIPLGNLVSNILIYQRVSRILNNTSLVNKDYAKDVATNGLRVVNSRSWIYQNFSQIGLKLAYERFLERNS